LLAFTSVCSSIAGASGVPLSRLDLELPVGNDSGP
jgi:hypothetical protein